MRPHALSAIAHSTWSHGSTWPSGQGIAPSGRWTAAIERAVCRTPGGGAGRAGSAGLAWRMGWNLATVRAERRCRFRLPGVDEQALADERVERGLRQPGKRGLAHDVPDEQPVVGADSRVRVVVHADRALEPP